MKICPKCGKVLAYNSYFGAYICTDCSWEDSSIGDNRNKGYIIEKRTFHKSKTFILKEKVLLTK